MSLWSDNPEWFDWWLEDQALKGRFGEEKKAQAEAGEFNADYDEWGRLDTNGELGAEAMLDFEERLFSD